MSLASKKPLIKQQTVYNGKEKAKMSHTTKRVSFDSTTIQSDSDEENSLGRRNRKLDDDDLLSMFKSELSESEDDILRRQSKVKSKGVDKRSLVTSHLSSAARGVNHSTDDLEQTISPKGKPRPRPRKTSEDMHHEEGSAKSAKPEVTPRKWQSGSMLGHGLYLDGMKKSKPTYDFSDSGDDSDIVIDISKDNHELPKDRNELSMTKSNTLIDQDNVNFSPNLITPGKTRKEKSLQGGNVLDKEKTNLEKSNRGMVPAPKPRKHIHEGSRNYTLHKDDDDDDSHSDDMEINRDMGKKIKTEPVPKARKEHLAELKEKEIIPESMLSKTRLHHIEVDDDENGEKTLKKAVDKRRQMPNRDKNGFLKDKVDGNRTKETTLDWSSLDESDDDEAIGKKVNLFKKARPRSAKAIDNNNNNKETSKVPKPLPRPRHHKEFGNVEQQFDNDMTNLDSYKQVPRIRGDNNRPGSSRHTTRIVTSQPDGSKAQSNTIGLGREEDDITDMLEEHNPDTNDLIGGHNNLMQQRIDQLRLRSSITPKKGPLRADQGIEAMTRSPHLRQTLTHTDNQDWVYPSQLSLGKQKSSSLRNLHRIEDSDDGSRRNSLDTETIRQTVYDNWLSRKNVTIKKELSKKALEKQKEEEKMKEEEERKKNAKLAFQSWNQHKTETLKEQHAKKKKKQKEEEEKMELERRMKEKDSKKYFESWKNKKDELIKEAHREKKKEDQIKKKKKDEEKLEKTMSSKKSFENWKSKKDTILKQKVKEKKTQEKIKKTNKEEESYEKTIKNADEFQKWVEKKGKPRKEPPPATLTQRAWVPGSRYISDSCIPTTVQPVVLPATTNRARTMSGTYRGKTKYYDF